LVEAGHAAYSRNGSGYSCRRCVALGHERIDCHAVPVPDDLSGGSLTYGAAFRSVVFRRVPVTLLPLVKVSEIVRLLVRLRRMQFQNSLWDLLGNQNATASAPLAPLSGPLYPARDNQSVELARMHTVTPDFAGSIPTCPPLNDTDCQTLQLFCATQLLTILR